MSESDLQGTLINDHLIASLAARTTLETPGVLRLEPTIQGFLARLGPSVLRSIGDPRSHDSCYQHDGISATIDEGIARVHLDIATDITYTALMVAESVQQRVRESIRHTGLTPGEIHIHILAIESGPSVTPL